jgi:hypothetical protein
LIRLVLFALLPGALVGAFVFLIHYLANPEDFIDEIPWWIIIAYAVLLFVATIRNAFVPANTLWSALTTDYPATPVHPDTVPRSAGLIGTAEHKELSNAMSFATKDGLHLRRLRRYLSNLPWVTIPWEKIESIEVIEPDREAIQAADTRQARRTLSYLLHAKVVLARNRSAMTLLVPWNEEFNKRVPPNVELIKNWEWPYSVM